MSTDTLLHDDRFALPGATQVAVTIARETDADACDRFVEGKTDAGYHV